MGHEVHREPLTAVGESSTMKPMRILLVNPPIFDFTAYDFWLRPYGMLRVAGRMRHACRLSFFDFLDSRPRDSWGRGSYSFRHVSKPKPLGDIPRRYRRYGKPRGEFREFLEKEKFDAVMVQTSMTYWYPGVREVIEDLRSLQPWARIILGGVYATLCSSHARSLGADLVVEGSDLDHLWNILSIEPEPGLPFQPETGHKYGVLKITEGCPFRCSYCASSIFRPDFFERPTAECLAEMQQLTRMGVRNIAFYDDALLYRPERGLIPFLEGVSRTGIPVLFHTPNALNARFVTDDLARFMVKAGFASFFLGLESFSDSWNAATGGKVRSEDFIAAVRHLREAGARHITAYIIVGHPDSDARSVEQSMVFAHENGARVLLSEFSPIPGTEDGRKSASWADLAEPLSHNKTAFAIRRLGPEQVNRLKDLGRSLNSQLLPG
ncbi:MAG: radical SAM protein [Acidobacteria bacterium]|nr:radical SAM protein [Acidobacteriota bacterium]